MGLEYGFLVYSLKGFERSLSVRRTWTRHCMSLSFKGLAGTGRLDRISHPRRIPEGNNMSLVEHSQESSVAYQNVCKMASKGSLEIFTEFF